MDLTTIEGIQRQLKRLSQQICCANSSVSELPVIQSGTYSPTIINNLNTSARSINDCQYMRVGNVVTVSGRLSITPTTSPAATSVYFTLPIPTYFDAFNLAGGAGASSNFGIPACIRADGLGSGNDQVEFLYQSINTVNNTFNFSFTYLVQVTPP